MALCGGSMPACYDPASMHRSNLSWVCALMALVVGCSSGSGTPGSPSTDVDSGKPGTHVAADAGKPGTHVAADAGKPGAHVDASHAKPDSAHTKPADAAAGDAAWTGAGEAGSDAGVAGDAGGTCEWGGAPGMCMTLPACAALGDHSSYANECPGPASIECCIVTPSTANNPPTPSGYELMQQSQVTSAMTTWAVAILDDPITYPMFATTTQTFGTQLVLARVEWHPPDFQNSVVHRGVTLYVPI